MTSGEPRRARCPGGNAEDRADRAGHDRRSRGDPVDAIHEVEGVREPDESEQRQGPREPSERQGGIADPKDGDGTEPPEDPRRGRRVHHDPHPPGESTAIVEPSDARDGDAGWNDRLRESPVDHAEEGEGDERGQDRDDKSQSPAPRYRRGVGAARGGNVEQHARDRESPDQAGRHDRRDDDRGEHGHDHVASPRYHAAVSFHPSSTVNFGRYPVALRSASMLTASDPVRRWISAEVTGTERASRPRLPSIPVRRAPAAAPR